VTQHLRLYFGSAAVLYAMVATLILVVTVWLNGVSMGDYAAPFQSAERVRDLVIFTIGLATPLIPCVVGLALASRRTGFARYVLVAAILGAIVALPFPHLVLGPLMVVRVLRGDGQSE
jgi:hypothetical protein